MSPSSISSFHEVTALDESGQVCIVQIANETPWTVFVDRHPLVTLMTLGNFPEALAIGYLRNQVMINGLNQIKSIQVNEGHVVHVTTHHGIKNGPDLPRAMTGCSQGSTLHGHQREKFTVSAEVKQSFIYMLLQTLAQYNQIYRQVGGVHGCALCQGTQILAFVEDVGRHNATDTIAGLMWLQEWTGEDKIFYTTGRLTSEIIMKVVHLGIPFLISRSGITYRGVQVAQATGTTVIAHAKGEHFLVFNGKEQILFDVNR